MSNDFRLSLPMIHAADDCLFAWFANSGHSGRKIVIVPPTRPGDHQLMRYIVEAANERWHLEELEAKRRLAGAFSLGDELLSLENLKQRYIAHVLARVDGAKHEAASILGVAPSTLYRHRQHAHERRST